MLAVVGEIFRRYVILLPISLEFLPLLQQFCLLTSLWAVEGSLLKTESLRTVTFIQYIGFNWYPGLLASWKEQEATVIRFKVGLISSVDRVSSELKIGW